MAGLEFCKGNLWADSRPFYCSYLQFNVLSAIPQSCQPLCLYRRPVNQIVIYLTLYIDLLSRRTSFTYIIWLDHNHQCILAFCRQILHVTLIRLFEPGRAFEKSGPAVSSSESWVNTGGPRVVLVARGRHLFQEVEGKGGILTLLTGQSGFLCIVGIKNKFS